MKLRRTRKMERSILDISFRDSTSIKVRNEEIRKRTRVDDTIECIAKQKWKSGRDILQEQMITDDTKRS